MMKMREQEHARSAAKFYYYKVYLGDATIEDFNITMKTLEYLKECGFSQLEIMRDVVSKSNTRTITIDNVPDKFWKDSLIKRNAFYLHNELRIVSPAPEYNPVTGEIKSYPFFCEMKIRYTAKDVLNYFYSRIGRMGAILADEKSDLRALSYLMKKYEKIDYVEPLDIILSLIDHASRNSEKEITKLIQITDNSFDIITGMQNDMLELEAKDRKKTIWRWENV